MSDGNPFGQIEAGGRGERARVLHVMGWPSVQYGSFERHLVSVARRCAEAGLVFAGPTAEVLDLFGDKARSRELAASIGLPVLAATTGDTSAARAQEFLAGLGDDAAVMVKAVGGGGVGQLDRLGGVAPAEERVLEMREGQAGPRPGEGRVEPHGGLEEAPHPLG